MNEKMDSSVFLKIPLFKDLPKAELYSLVSELPVEKYQAGDYIFHEGEPGNSLYVVQKGKIDVVLAGGTNDEMLLRTCGPGEYVGEMSLILKQGKRTAAVRVREDSQLWMMTRDKFNECLQRWPHLAYAMVEIISERLDSSNEAAFNDLVKKNQMLQKAYDDLKAAQAQLIEKERLERELQLAADIQLSILPDVLPDTEEFGFGARILPARQVGGDFYDVFQLKDDRIGVLIGDVADKGVPSALFMARAHALIMAEADIGATPAEVMNLVNSHITRLQKSTQFVTVLYGILDLKTRIFSYARAGHEPPLVLHTDGSVERIPHSPGMAIGLWEPVTLDEKTVKLSSGDTLLLYTDGMTDCRDPQGDAFGLERIKDKLGELSKQSAQQICNTLLETLQNHQNGAKQDDDVTLVAVKAK
ncbi:MAG TPA: SpoIIE family protein phosphatase [Anaerolineales bacterium]|nr:SpoIIE family protein phosphatase [Anaerolineales bacterium]HND47740.1 SpoIIE family protein phosphatase [Anaerolineales bacterium]HNE04497.1 SpoIIE family protein phosphatase [Anaerolineales bacterium]HNF93827.1 SpoIIE family protein phosphatase [Anaerolineales bacterium]HNH25531.1 SpoIIE family protein phosphatase [Anaerolineales bacterium]